MCHRARLVRLLGHPQRVGDGLQLPVPVNAGDGGSRLGQQRLSPPQFIGVVDADVGLFHDAGRQGQFFVVSRGGFFF